MGDAFAQLQGGISSKDIPKAIWSPARGNTASVKPSVVKVDMLSKKHAVGGSDPQDKKATSGTTGWAKIYNSGLTKASDKWVQMHLVNEKLGGEGYPYNLVPGRNTTNSGTMRSFESFAKKLVLENKNSVIWWETRVSYHGGASKDYPSRIDQKVGLYIFEGNKKWKKDAKHRLQNISVMNKPDFSKKPIPSLSSPSHTLFSIITYKGKSYKSIFTQTVMKRIKSEIATTGKGYNTLSEFETRMLSFVPKNLKSTRGINNWHDNLQNNIIPAIKVLHKGRKIKIR